MQEVHKSLTQSGDENLTSVCPLKEQELCEDGDVAQADASQHVLSH